MKKETNQTKQQLNEDIFVEKLARLLLVQAGYLEMPKEVDLFDEDFLNDKENI